MPPDTLVFNVPDKLVRILDRDLKAAGIPKRDDRGRTVDVHAVRMTFGTLLSKAGVAPRTAQAAMRHSTIDLTTNVYTDPRLLDVAGAMEALPALPLEAGPQREAAAVSATGTDDLTPSPLVPVLVPTAGKPGILGSILDKLTSNRGESEKTGTIAASACPVKRNNPLTTAVNGLHQGWETGLEPATPRSTIWCSNQLSYTHHLSRIVKYTNELAGGQSGNAWLPNDPRRRRWPPARKTLGRLPPANRRGPGTTTAQTHGQLPQR